MSPTPNGPTWQDTLKSIGADSDQADLADQIEREFARIDARKRLTKAKWIGIAASISSQLMRAQSLQKSIPELAAELMMLGATRKAQAGGKARAASSARSRSEVGEWLKSNYTPTSYAERGAKTRALHEARDKFCSDTFKLDERTMRKIAREVGLTD
jgi:hypothetical protein